MNLELQLIEMEVGFFIFFWAWPVDRWLELQLEPLQREKESSKREKEQSEGFDVFLMINCTR